MICRDSLETWLFDEALYIQWYNLYRKNRNVKGGGIACYVQNHIPVKVREDIMSKEMEVFWLQVNLPHIKPILVGCCCRPPSSNHNYYHYYIMCELNMEVVFTGEPVNKYSLVITKLSLKIATYIIV